MKHLQISQVKLNERIRLEKKKTKKRRDKEQIIKENLVYRINRKEKLVYRKTKY